METAPSTERDGRAPRDFTDGLPPFADVVLALASVDGADATGPSMDVARLRVSFPVELEIEADEEGRVAVRGAPPLVLTRTDVMPVFHQLTLTFVGGGADGE